MHTHYIYFHRSNSSPKDTEKIQIKSHPQTLDSTSAYVFFFQKWLKWKDFLQVLSGLEKLLQEHLLKKLIQNKFSKDYPQLRNIKEY